MENITRRDLMKSAGVAAGAVAVAGVALSAPKAYAMPGESFAGEVEVPKFLIAPEPITDISETKDYDIVVIGAGAAGVPAVLTAIEAGASVACLQKESVAVSQGNGGAGVDAENSDPAAIEALVSLIIAAGQYRPRRALVADWAHNSGETFKWLNALSTEAGATFSETVSTYEFPCGTVNTIGSYYGPKPLTAGDGMIALATLAEQKGAEFFYETPAVQLVKDGDAVTGVIAQNAEGAYIQFNAAKGVVVATGDYQNDLDMCSYYLPDLNNFERKQFNKTGDGHKMIVWAGGKIEDIGHTKMLHDFDAGPMSMCDTPYLAVKDDGTRFCDETTGMSLLNNFLRGPQDCGWYSQIFDSDYMTVAADWTGTQVDPEGLKTYMPEDEGEKAGVFPALVRTFVADTLEELAAKLEISDVDQFLATVERYNELCEKGVDEDFGKDPQYLAPIVTPPFYGIHRHLRVSAICSGVDVADNLQCVTPDGTPIPGLWAAGNVAGNFYGGVDYPLEVGGLSLGRCYHQGRVAVKNILGL